MGRLKRMRRRGAALPAAALARLRSGARAAAGKRGAPPGTLVYSGPEAEEPVRLSYLVYDHDELRQDGRAPADSAELEVCLRHLSGPEISWINVDGLHDVGVIEALGSQVGLHRLVMEDILHTSQRAKVEEYPDHIYLVIRMLTWDEEADHLRDEQVSLVLGKNFVLSFQERVGDVFEGVRDRLRHSRGTIRQRGPDYLAYALMDSVVDHYFSVIERVSDHIENLEIEILEDPEHEVVERVHRLKREMLLVRRAIWPLREVVSQLYRDEFDLVAPDTRVFLRDVYDHTVQVIDTVETLRDLLGGLMDLYLSGVSNRMNEVMKVLTMIATIFIPLSFLAGLYGMNFDVMPELHVAWGYPALLGVMALVAAGMVAYFRRKKWL
ncbi:MAG TPA: magnesium/cobalt transporter CorA [Longimicrobiales bacterium]|nr:magnesium/cobalt transporter CorA [Longimicrobiales bacterium]